MKRMKVSLCAVLAAVVFSLAACGGKGGVPTLTWWTIGTPQPGFAEDMKVISDYTMSKIGVRVDIMQAG
jgi:ABC-type glycerol-3-phosphate transport system substrate-binding protein